MKKILSLVLMLVLILAVCTSCTGKEKAEGGEISYHVYNLTGEKIMKITKTYPDRGIQVTSNVASEGTSESHLLDSFGLSTADEKGIVFSYTTESGYTMETELPLRDTTIILLPREKGGIRFADPDADPSTVAEE